MVKYIIKRVLLGILTLFVLIAITFAMTKVMPGSPLQSKNISGDVLKKMEATYGLDKPPVEQFIIYCKNLLHGDMGTSYKKVGKSVNEIIAQTMMPTLQLGIVTLVLVLVVGVSSGILMARAKSNAVNGVQCTKLYRSIASSDYIRCRTEDVPCAWSYNTNALCASGYRPGIVSNLSSCQTDTE